jgi:glucokinase
MPIGKPSKKKRSRRTTQHSRNADHLETLVIGVDIGGTKVAAGIVDCATGEIHEQTRTAMPARGSAEDGLAAVNATIEQLLRGAAPESRNVRAIGMCAPGPLDPRTGVIINPPNVPCWRDYPLAERISKSYRLPVRLDNDANAAALAETIWGAGHGYQNVFYTTIGTGIGTGIVLDGKILHGRTGAAGEGGHVSIDFRGVNCACGKRGCIEALASGPAIARAARAVLEKRARDSSVLLALCNGNPDEVTCEIVGQAFAKGDRIASGVLDQTIEYLAHWLGNIIDLLEPEIIVIGGGVSAMLTPFLEKLSARLPGCCENQRARDIPIVPARFGENAGIGGAAAICRDVVARR